MDPGVAGEGFGPVPSGAGSERALPALSLSFPAWETPGTWPGFPGQGVHCAVTIAVMTFSPSMWLPWRWTVQP